MSRRGKGQKLKKVYLGKKNPEMPAGRDNWTVMNSYEFYMFMQTPEGQRRRPNFGQLDGCDPSDVIIIAECGEKTAGKWRTEKDRHDYLAEAKERIGYTTFSYHGSSDENGEDLAGEDLIADEDTDVEETVVIRIMKDKLRIAIMSLDAEERHLINRMFLSDNPMTEKEYAALTGKPRSTVNSQKVRILEKLKQLMSK